MKGRYSYPRFAGDETDAEEAKLLKTDLLADGLQHAL